MFSLVSSILLIGRLDLLSVSFVIERLRVEHSGRYIRCRVSSKTTFALIAATFMCDCCFIDWKVFSQAFKLSFHLSFDDLNQFSSFLLTTIAAHIFSYRR